jgi:hypothetical protein
LLARSGFGDLFLRKADGSIVWLDVAAGTLKKAAETESQFFDLGRQPEWRDRWFGETDLESSAERGLTIDELQCIGFKTPLVFSESADVPDNAYVADLYEQVSFLGDLHRQIASVPGGGTARLTVRRSG